MDRLRILIVEDEQLIAESLSEILECLNHEVVGVASSADKALELVESESPDIVLLDIQIDGDKDGVYVADLINEVYNIPYIFTTAFADPQTLQRAKEKCPYGYIVKPYGIKDIHAALEIALTTYSRIKSLNAASEVAYAGDNSIFLKVDGRLVKVKEEDILWIEAKGDYAVFKTAENSYIVHSTMKNIEAKLNQRLFIKVHRSFIINLNKIIDIEDSNLLIKEKIIPISRANKESLMTRINLI